MTLLTFAMILALALWIRSQGQTIDRLFAEVEAEMARRPRPAASR